ncbi:MAG TPA: winged helix-turn-helix transcriptional regulator, partial [Allosphingosinicella sp.]
SDLRGDLPGISANVLTQRLEGLEAAGLLVRRKLPPPAPAQVYELTPWGYEAEPIVQSLGKWAARSPAHDPTLPISATSIMLSFRTMFDPARAGDLRARIGFRLGSETFVARVEDGRFESARGDPEGADVVFTGTAQGLAAFVYGGLPVGALESAGMLKVDGDLEVAKRFATLFPLPPKVGS